MKLTAIYIYPIKSFRGISLEVAELTPSGLLYDREWMIVNENNEYITQREYPQMSQFEVKLNGTHLFLKNLSSSSEIEFDGTTHTETTIEVKIWNDQCNAFEMPQGINDWLRRELQIDCKMVRIKNTRQRQIDLNFAPPEQYTTFTDGFPFLLISEESLALLNSKLDEEIEMERFRPNFVISGGDAHVEDNMGKWTIGTASFEAVKLCSRCVVTTIHLETAKKSKEPLKTLAKYRRFENKIMFGQNLLYTSGNQLQVGDKVTYLTSN